MADVPVGDVTVSAANPTLHLRAEGSGTIDDDGDMATINLMLENNLIDLPTNRWDANNFAFDIQKDASILNGTNTVFAESTQGRRGAGAPRRDRERHDHPLHRSELRHDRGREP